MQISAIRYNTPASYQRKNSKNHITRQSFKGYTHKLERFCSQFDMNGYYYRDQSFVKYRYPDRLEDTGVRLKWEELTPYERDIYSSDEGYMPRIYIASPYEEIPPEVYKTHTHIQKNDLWMSQIKEDSKWGFKNFAANAVCEMEHYKELQAKIDEIVNKNTKEIELLKKRYEETSKSCPENINADFEEKYNSRISQLENEIKEVQEKSHRIDQNMEKAKKRYDVLKKLDDLCKQFSEKNAEASELNYDSYCGIYQSNREKLEANLEALEKLQNIKQEQVKRLLKMTSYKIGEIALEKSEQEMFTIEKSIEETKRTLNNMNKKEDFKQAMIAEIRSKEMLEIKEKIEAELKNVDEFYKKYYPQWADI